MSNWLGKGWPHVWLPYTQMQLADTPLPVISAEGSELHLADGRTLIDGIASWWSTCHGYQHPHLVQALVKQAETLSHVMMGGLANKPAFQLAERLVKIVPSGLQHVFFSDSGSVAVEVAMKMAVQYWANKGQRNRTKFISFQNGYHGDTMGAMSLADPSHSMHSGLAGYMPQQYVLDIPIDEYSLAEFTAILQSGVNESAAAIIIEPLMQGAGGMKFHSPDMLAEIYRLAKENDLLFIADEIATGFGRTGSMFACEEAGITPDILCLGKALTGGMVGLAATFATDEIYNAFLSDDRQKALMHGPTYMGNALACAVANASLDLFEQEPRLKQVDAIEQQLWAELIPLAQHAAVKDIRVKGAIGVVQLKEKPDVYALRKNFVEQGVFIRPFDDVIYLMPAFTITPEQLSKLTAAIGAILEA